MEQPRETQPPNGAGAYPYPYPPQAYQQPAPRPSPFRVVGVFLRFLLRRLVYGLVWLLRPLRPHAFFVVIILALLGVMGWMATQIWGGQAAAPSDQRVAAVEQTPAVQNYLTGLRTFNPDLMWDAYNSNYQNTQIQQGASKATLASSTSQEKRLGLQYRNIQYIGAVKRDSGGHIYNYVIDVVYQNTTWRIPMVFGSDKDEKIEYIVSPLDNLIQRIMQ